MPYWHSAIIQNIFLKSIENVFLSYECRGKCVLRNLWPIFHILVNFSVIIIDCIQIFGSVRVNAHRPTSREALCYLAGLKWHRIMFAFLNFSTFTWSEVIEVHLLQGETNLK